MFNIKKLMDEELLMVVGGFGEPGDRDVIGDANAAEHNPNFVDEDDLLHGGGVGVPKGQPKSIFKTRALSTTV